jgi:uncharacterized protein
MSGLIALLDDVAAIAKVAAATVDDVAAAATKAGAKAAGVLIDDVAVSPKYVTGFSPERELPIIGRIALGSLRNKLLVLLPAALVLSAFLPAVITPLLMVGGCYLCFEGAEKVFHWLFPLADQAVAADMATGDPGHLEEEKVAGAIKTDFILSAEIMTIALSAIPDSTIWTEALTLAVVGVAITFVVYGGVALIVKADDVGLAMARRGRLSGTRAMGRAIVAGMPRFLSLLTLVGTLAMLWVGGSIVLHGLADLGLPFLYDTIHHWAETAAHALPQVAGFISWLVTAFFDGLFGLVLGLALIPVGTRVIGPLWAAVFGGRAAH